MNSIGMNTFGVALSGIHAAETRMAVSAHNVANWQTPSFTPWRVTQATAPGGGVATTLHRDSAGTPSSAASVEGVDLAREFVDQSLAKTQFGASLRVIGVNAELTGSLVDMLA